VDQIVTTPDTWSEIVVTLLGTAACAGVVLLGARGRAWAAVTIGLFAGLTAFTALSIAWSVQPDFSWFAADQMLSYLAVFAGAAALARLGPQRWPALVGAIGVLMAALSGYALLVKVLPGTLDPNDTLGRLQAPFGYWNAIGVSAALGLPVCLWSGARRDRGRALRVLSVPALALMMSVVVLSYSRSALLVAVLGGGCWLALVPLRLRAVLTLALGSAGAAAITGWALATPALTSDGVSLPARTAAGHSFGIVLLVVLVMSIAAGFAAVWAGDRVAVAPAARRSIGTVLVTLVALIPVGGLAAVAASSRGFTGEISHAWSTLTSVNEGVGNSAGRLGQLGNSRPLYWHQGLEVGEHALLKGVGALGYSTARLRYASARFKADHAHSYLIETFADLGLIGVAISLALLAAWSRAAVRSLAPRTRWSSLTPEQVAERQGLLTVLIVAVMFGVQSAIDWTWYFPGVAIPALICAGWLAGRGPLANPVGRLRERRPILQRPAAGATVTALVAVALLGAWVMWQPLRSTDADAAATVATSNPQAFDDARSAASSDPLSYEPLFLLSALYQRIGDNAAARAQLVRATRRQPQNPVTWEQLGSFDLQIGDPRQALSALTRGAALDHASTTDGAEIAQARAALARQR
jgi:tetratricopeptide (TPR) repeat protein